MKNNDNALSRKLNTYLLPLLFTILQPLIHGYRFDVSDQSINYPLILKTMDQSLFQNDPMLDTLSSYVSFYPKLMAVFTSMFSNHEVLFYLLYLGVYYAFFSIVYRISKLLFDETTSLITLVIIASMKPMLGGGTIHVLTFYPFMFVFCIVLYALYQFLKGKDLIAFVIIGLCVNLHALTAGYAASLVCLSITWQLLNKEYTFKKWLTRGTLLVVCAAPTLVWSVLTSDQTQSWDLWMDMIKLRGGQHSFPSTWSYSTYLNFFLFLSIGLISLYRLDFSKVRMKVVHFFAAVFILFFIGLVFVEFFPVKTIIRIQPFRSSIFLITFCTIFIAGFIRRHSAPQTSQRLLVVLLLATLFVSYSWITLTIAIVLSIALILNHKRPFHISPILIISLLAIGGIAMIFLGLSEAQMDKLLSMTSAFERKILFVVVSAFIGINAYLLHSNRMNGSKGRFAMVIATVIVIGFALPTIYRYYHPEDKSLLTWRRTQEWAKENSLKTDIFMTPPHLYGFRVYSHRPIVGEQKDGSQMYFNEDFGKIWKRRMESMNCLVSADNCYDKLSKERLVELAQLYHAKYLVMPSSSPLELPTVYTNEDYSIYQLN